MGTDKNYNMLKMVIILILIFGIYMIKPHIHSKDIEYTMTCVDKMTTQSRDGGKIYYHIIFKDSNGNLHKKERSMEHYYYFQVGKDYVFTDTDYYWE